MMQLVGYKDIFGTRAWVEDGVQHTEQVKVGEEPIYEVVSEALDQFEAMSYGTEGNHGEGSSIVSEAEDAIDGTIDFGDSVNCTEAALHLQDSLLAQTPPVETNLVVLENSGRFHVVLEVPSAPPVYIDPTQVMLDNRTEAISTERPTARIIGVITAQERALIFEHASHPSDLNAADLAALGLSESAVVAALTLANQDAPPIFDPNNKGFPTVIPQSTETVMEYTGTNDFWTNLGGVVTEILTWFPQATGHILFPDAGHALHHFNGNYGTPLAMPVPAMYQYIDALTADTVGMFTGEGNGRTEGQGWVFAEVDAALSILQQSGLPPGAIQNADGSITLPFGPDSQDDWRRYNISYDEDPNLHLTFGGFWYSIGGEMTLTQSANNTWQVELEYQVYMYDRYAWDADEFSIVQLAQPGVQTGMSANFDFYGMSTPQTIIVEQYTPGTDARNLSVTNQTYGTNAFFVAPEQALDGHPRDHIGRLWSQVPDGSGIALP